MVSASERSELHVDDDEEVRLLSGFGRELAAVFLRVCLSSFLLGSPRREKNFILCDVLCDVSELVEYVRMLLGVWTLYDGNSY